jgi:o-succinylbenzoate synthase
VASVREFAVELAGPLATAAGEIHRRRGVLIGAVHPDGSTGVGEATPLPGWTESYEDCLATIEARRRAGTDGDPEGRVESPGATGGSSPRTAGTGGPRSTRVADDADERPVAPAADHGIELARLDASARAAGESLAAFLADGRDPAVEAPERVPVNATVGDGDRAETVAAAEAARESGYGCLKLKVGVRSVTADVARVEAVRDAVGDAVDLRVDANGAWDREQARRALSALDGTLEYVEQPLPAPDIEGHADLRGVGPPIALDESLASHDPVAVLSADAADVLIVKPMALGGLDRARRVARRAATTGVDAVVTTTIDAAVARVGAVHLAASLQSDRACGLATGGLLADDLLGSDPAPIVDGAVRVPDGDGLGDAFAPLRGGGGAR